MSRDIVAEIMEGSYTRQHREAWLNVQAERGIAHLGFTWGDRQSARAMWGRDGYRIHVVLEEPEERACRKWLGERPGYRPSPTNLRAYRAALAPHQPEGGE